ncbi:uncharacterized protein LOC119268687 [Triticum dicoccoides]|uniref:uncharacterized protein LOC119268687 n=1 Tax=Triticum dicoccoides TaxID=85692 RepID=UPI0018901DFE|nr:uncharacterized protein LOC119268687 [Triticum dicoccoides]
MERACGHGRQLRPRPAQWRMLPTRKATAGQSTAARSDEETAAAPDVGLGAGSSAARATPAKEDAATAAMTTARKILELEAMILAARKKMSQMRCSSKNCGGGE